VDLLKRLIEHQNRQYKIDSSSQKAPAPEAQPEKEEDKPARKANFFERKRFVNYEQNDQKSDSEKSQTAKQNVEEIVEEKTAKKVDGKEEASPEPAKVAEPKK